MKEKRRIKYLYLGTDGWNKGNQESSKCCNNNNVLEYHYEDLYVKYQFYNHLIH